MNPKVEIQEEMKEEKRTNECVLEGALTLLPSFFFSPWKFVACVERDDYRDRKKKKRFILYESVDSLQPVATFTRAVLQTYR